MPATARKYTADEKRAIIAARDAAPLADFWAALTLGRLVLCANCRAFRFADDPSTAGHCEHWSVETFAFAPFDCGAFSLSEMPTAPAYVAAPVDGARAGRPQDVNTAEIGSQRYQGSASPSIVAPWTSLGASRGSR